MPNKKRDVWNFQIWEEGRFFILGPSVRFPPPPPPPPPPHPGTFIFSYIHRLGHFFLVQTFEFHFFFRKLNILGGGGGGLVGRFCGYNFGSLQNWTIFRGHFYTLEWQGTEWRIFFWLLKFQIFIWGAWNSWYFWVNGRCWTLAYVW